VNPQPRTVVAIDGPAASGKSSVARSLAARLGFTYVNTGAMYRAATWLALERGVPSEDADAVARLLDTEPLAFALADGASVVLFAAADIGGLLDRPEVNANVSTVARHPAIRERLVARQREFAGDADLVMEGRDIGSAVFPDTPYKFYIDASPEVRARRRAAQGLRDAIGDRDRSDSQRAASPLLVAPGATVIDSSDLSVEGVVDAIAAQLSLLGLPAR
jgi:cytidylate kinase